MRKQQLLLIALEVALKPDAHSKGRMEKVRRIFKEYKKSLEKPWWRRAWEWLKK